MPVEIERKFLVVGREWRGLSRPVRFCQGYLVSEKDLVVRVRLEGQRGRLAVKSRLSDAARLEFEYDIPRDHAGQLLEKVCLRPLIVKDRRRVEYKGFWWDIDEFLEENQGLVVAEIELPSLDTQFARPPFIGPEVTHCPRYLNSNLIRRPFSRWSEEERAE